MSLKTDLQGAVPSSLLQGPNVEAFIDSGVARHDAIETVVRAIVEQLDPENGVGDRLDIIGAILGRKRLGLTDDRYRGVLQAQRALVLSSKGSTETLVTVAELVSQGSVISYLEVYPAAAILTVSFDTSHEDLTIPLLREMLNKAKNGGIRLWLTWGDTDEILLADSDSISVDSPGNVDSDSVVVTDNFPTIRIIQV